MEISETSLRELIQRVMELTLELSGESPKTRVLVVLSGSRAETFSSALRALKEDGGYEITVAANPRQMEDESIGPEICRFSQKIVDPDTVLTGALDYDRICFPAMPRDVLAKCALCIPDSFEPALVQRALEEDIPVIIAKGGLTPFTGREPAAYQERILGYVRMLLEYGIEIQMDEKER